MRRLLTFLLAVQGLATAAEPADDKPDYSTRKDLFSQVVLTPVPNARFMNVDAKKKYKDCLAKNKTLPEDKQEVCVNYEFTAPFSTQAETIRVATDLREAWQRFQDRYYWRAMTELNNPDMLLTNCLVNINTGTRASDAILTVNTEPFMYPKALADKIPVIPVDDRLTMDSYGLIPKVGNSDYCTGLSPRFDFMYIPGECTYLFGFKVFCIQGSRASLNPAAPNPLNFRYDLALSRIQSATKTAHTDYLKDYAVDVLKALQPTTKFFPLMWSDLDGAVIAPTTALRANYLDIFDRVNEAGKKLEGQYQFTTYLYYLQAMGLDPMKVLRVHQLPGSTDILKVPDPPGIWKFEEFKRRFPVNTPKQYERFGYVTVFQSWNETVTKLLPEEVYAKALRQMIYYASGVNFYLPDMTAVPLPAPMLISEYSAGLPFVGPQARYTWVSVGDGYPVPRVKGLPAVDYQGVTK